MLECASSCRVLAVRSSEQRQAVERGLAFVRGGGRQLFQRCSSAIRSGNAGGLGSRREESGEAIVASASRSREVCREEDGEAWLSADGYVRRARPRIPVGAGQRAPCKTTAQTFSDLGADMAQRDSCACGLVVTDTSAGTASDRQGRGGPLNFQQRWCLWDSWVRADQPRPRPR